MKALIIDPTSRTVEEIDYPVATGLPGSTIKEIMGAGFTYGGKRSNGDKMILISDWLENDSYKPFILFSTTEVYFGKMAVIGLSIETGEFSDCATTIEEMASDIEYCNMHKKLSRHRSEIKYRYFARSKDDVRWPRSDAEEVKSINKNYFS